MTYDDWDQMVPAEIRAEPVWTFAGYRKALFLNDLIWADTDHWLSDPPGRANAQQVVDSLGSISANIEAGHGRGDGKQLLLFYTDALASARESKGWYFRSRRFIESNRPHPPA